MAASEMTTLEDHIVGRNENGLSPENRPWGVIRLPLRVLTGMTWEGLVASRPDI